MRSLRTAGLFALATAARACDIQSLSTQTEAMNDKCCANGNCDASGVPTTCTNECRPAFETFWKDCGAYMNYLPGTESMKEFAAKCEDSKPDSSGSKVTTCDAGTLLTTLLFSCSGVDQNNAQEFCDTECSRGVKEYVHRCKGKESAAANIALTQAEGWLRKCIANKDVAKCHSAVCNGAHDNLCAKGNSRGACNQLSAQDNNVFCKWQVCKSRGPPPPPAAKRPGCTDKKALNFDPKANVMAPGACLYGPPPSPPDGPPPAPMPCTKNSFYGCKTQAACELVKRQWVPCSETTKYGGVCSGMNLEDGGQCIMPCTESEPQNCHTPEKCRAAGKCQGAVQPGDGDVNCARTTHWYTPPKEHAGTYQQPSRCERGCSAKSTYTCRTDAECIAIDHQWVPGTEYTSSTGTLIRQNPGSCQPKCSKASPYSCHSKATCESLADHQWLPSTCCGTGCGTPAAGQELGSCQVKCSLARPYECHNQIDCEAVGRQWVTSTAMVNPRCPSIAPRGSCMVPCTEDHYYDCKSKTDCEAIGLEWHEPVQHGSFTQQGRCSPKCSLAVPNECDTEAECQGIGYQWAQINEGFPTGDPMPGMKTHFCEEPCYEHNQKGCKSQKDCERIGKGQWVMQRMSVCADCGGIDGGFGGRPEDKMREGFEKEVAMEYRRRAQVIDPGFGVGGTLVGRCEPPCGADNLYSCTTESACTGIEGKWQKRNPPMCRGGPCPVDPNMPPPPTGYCQQGCSVEDPFMCKTQAACGKIGGEWKTHHQLGRPTTQICDVSNAPCDAALFLTECGGSDTTKIGAQGVELCDDKCGRFIQRNYDRCAKHPPKGSSKADWIKHFGPIVSMCKSLRADPSLSRCTNQMEEATDTLNKVCCTKNTHCAANHGHPSKCTGSCADTFLPFFQECGAVFLKERGQTSSLGQFYHTCTASHHEIAGPDPKICAANAGNAPWVDIEFRTGCGVWIKYVDAKTKAVSKDFERLVSVGGQSVDQLLDVAKTVCGKNKMINRMAEDFSGILALADIDEKGSTLAITVNHPAIGNAEVEVTNTPANRRAVKAVWRKKFNVNVFNPEHCPL